MIDMYTSAVLTALYGISRETVRQWVNEFKEYLSPGATPSAGRQRIFNDSDMRVFALIHEMKGRGALYEDIHAAFKAGQRGELPSTLHNLVQDGATDNRALTLRKEVERLQMALSLALEDGQRKAGKIELLEAQIDAMQSKIDNLNREIGRLEGRGIG